MYLHTNSNMIHPCRHDTDIPSSPYRPSAFDHRHTTILGESNQSYAYTNQLSLCQPSVEVANCYS